MSKQFPVLKAILLAAMAVGIWQAEPFGFAGMVRGAEAPHAEADAGGHAEGEPESPITFAGDLALWSLVVFVLFIIVLKKMAWGPLIAGLDRREAKMREDIENAEKSRVQAERLLAEHAKKLDAAQDEIRGILAEARKDAEHARQEMLAAAEKETEAVKQRAVHEIERVKDQALDELFSEMGRVVSSATERVIGRVLTEPDHDRLINEALTEFSGRTAS